MFFDSVKNRKEVSSVCVISVGFVGTPVDSGVELLTQSQGLRNLDFSVRNSRAGLGVNAWLESQLWALETADHRFKVILDYVVNSRLGWVCEPCLKKTK